MGFFAFSPVVYQVDRADGVSLLTNPAFRELHRDRKSGWSRAGNTVALGVAAKSLLSWCERRC